MRDYGRNDLTQIRIKKDRLLDPDVPHLYIRGDGTRVYFFEKDELERLVTASPREETAKREMFEVLQLGEDRRMVSRCRRRISTELMCVREARESEGEEADVSDMAASEGEEAIADAMQYTFEHQVCDCLLRVVSLGVGFLLVERIRPRFALSCLRPQALPNF